MLKTGTLASAASSSSIASGPVRTPIAATWRESTSAVSRDRLAAARAASRPGAGPSGGRRARRRRPRSDTRVRVDGFSKMQRDGAPVERAARSSGAAFSSSARSSERARARRRSSSAPVRRWRVKPGSIRAAMLRPHLEPLPRPRGPAGGPRRCYAEFAATLAGWEWDVALLQEVPPWWPPRAGRGERGPARTALTSRNALLPLRRALAARAGPTSSSPTAAARTRSSSAAGASPSTAQRRLRRRPERRVVHAVRLGDGPWVANVHAQVHSEARAQADIARAAAMRCAAGRAARRSSSAATSTCAAPRAPGFTDAGGHGVDHVLARGLRPVASEVLERGACPITRPCSSHWKGIPSPMRQATCHATLSRSTPRRRGTRRGRLRLRQLELHVDRLVRARLVRLWRRRRQVAAAAARSPST